ncbi:VPLPA-CTERM sorting domain-containing protein [Octadecabacter sp.]|nr:VPLPA-CTERM sorting domain-containing protein [Octadecabacter sp.]
MQKLLSTAVLLGLFASAASAETIRFSGSSSDETTIGVEQFDPGLGSLTAALFRIRGGGSVVDSQIFELGEDVFLEVSTFARLEFLGLEGNDFGFDTVDEGICVDPDGCEAAVFFGTTAEVFGDFEEGFDDLSPFIGTGFLTASLFADTPDVNLSYNITYTFTPAVVPLPASLPLLLVGLGGLGVVYRRKRAVG